MDGIQRRKFFSSFLSFFFFSFFFFFCKQYFYSSVDIAGKLWVCPFCFQRNPFPPRYGNLQSSPPELVPHFTTVEYRLSKPYSPPPAFLFVVDLSLPPESLQHVKDSLMMAISLLPESSHVGLITFAETVFFFLFFSFFFFFFFPPTPLFSFYLFSLLSFFLSFSGQNL